MRRRDFLSLSGVTVPALWLGRTRWPVFDPDVTRVAVSIGIQLYTVRREMAAGMDATLSRLSAIGYREVEFAGYFDHRPEAVRALLAANHLSAPSTHVGLEVAEDDAIWDIAAEIGHRYVVIPSLPDGMGRTLDDWRRIADRFNRIGERARRVGLRFAYHNHDSDVRVLESRMPLDLLCEATDPELVSIQLDIFWMVQGGGDPARFLTRWEDRVPMVHVKDRTADGRMVDVGRGTIDWGNLLEKRAGRSIQHLFVEHDRPADPFGSAQAGFTYLRSLLP